MGLSQHNTMFSTGRLRENPYLVETVEIPVGQQTVGGVTTESRIAALEAAVASLQAVVTALTGATIGDNAATFNGTGTGYELTVNGSVAATSVTATDIYAKTYHTLCPYSVRVGDGKEVLHISENGDMGVGTASPAARLHVVGDLVVEGKIVVRGE